MASNLTFSDEFIDKLPPDLTEGVILIGKTFYQNFKTIKTGSNTLEECISAHSIMYNYLKNHDIDPGQKPSFDLDTNKILESVNVYIRPIYDKYLKIQREKKAKEKFNEINAKISSKFDNYLIYELNEDQIKDIQSLINELRDRVYDCEAFENSHKQRILDKLEKLQNEIHKKVTDFDKFYGFVVEMRFIYENYKETKPLFDMAVKIANIALDSMAIANGLPAPSLFKLT